jgi:hypothetical protein
MLTEIQQRYIDAVKEHGSNAAAARMLGINESTVRRTIKRAARHDPSLHADGAPEGYLLKGVSTFTKTPSGGAWVKTAVDKEAMREVLEAVVQDIADSGRGLLEPLPPPASVLADDYLAVYPLPDPHLRLLTWKPETGKNYDLKIAEREIKATFDGVVATAAYAWHAEKALLISLGDFFHSDGESPFTPANKNILDTEGRFGKAAVAGVRILRHMIDRLLSVHQEVEVFLIAGNHDENQAVWLSIVMAAVYEKEPRVTIHVDPARFQRYEFGRCLIGAAHGHTIKLARLPGVMANDWAEQWGRTHHRHWYIGHEHHDEGHNEDMGASWETLRTTAPNDAWHSGRGYRASRDLKCDIWHKETGRKARFIQEVTG